MYFHPQTILLFVLPMSFLSSVLLFNRSVLESTFVHSVILTCRCLLVLLNGLTKGILSVSNISSTASGNGSFTEYVEDLPHWCHELCNMLDRAVIEVAICTADALVRDGKLSASEHPGAAAIVLLLQNPPVASISSGVREPVEARVLELMASTVFRKTSFFLFFLQTTFRRWRCSHCLQAWTTRFTPTRATSLLPWSVSRSQNTPRSSTLQPSTRQSSCAISASAFLAS